MSEGPVIPEFGQGSECVRENRTFCVDWVEANWDTILWPRLVEHVQLTALAVSIGFAIAFAAALLAYRHGWFEGPFAAFSGLLYTIPSLALFQLLVPITGLTVTTVEVALVSYTLLILFRNILSGLRAAPPEVLEAARGMGMTRQQTLVRVVLPLAVPAIVAGIRIATVTTISLATVAAFVLPEGLGQPILDGLRTFFTTKFIAAGALAVALAVAVDGVLVLAQRAATPWTRARSAA
jgi:osmoprotectant transport system permease protein